MELPSITASSYASSAVNSEMLFGALRPGALGIGVDVAHASVLNQFQHAAAAAQKETTVSNARIVKVFIADPNENLPLEKRVLHSGDEQLTDLTDQELFYEVPIADILAKHNQVRKSTVDKKQAEKFGRDIFLEPARIRDLKMVVVTVAQF